MIRISKINGNLEVTPLVIGDKVMFTIGTSKIILSSSEFDIFLEELNKIKENKTKIITTTIQ